MRQGVGRTTARGDLAPGLQMVGVDSASGSAIMNGWTRPPFRFPQGSGFRIPSEKEGWRPGPTVRSPTLIEPDLNLADGSRPSLRWATATPSATRIRPAEPVEQLGDGSGGQAQLLGQVARGRRAVDEQAHALQVGQGHAELVGHGEVEPHRGGCVGVCLVADRVEQLLPAS